ncbi:M36 family metallopeptidase [Amnibacterium sp. CER49]|uniref:M4 family metallopeptidase n=1 Tax=Amnibacterium sp. CER49 TaxID=3039161 RepID=UPI00244CDD6F|nr:M36 family metallopeptidase [Amnibacterium sp. CER49]MDH2444579.1 M36 family metallopeptidase [Amnibacterium sp. CER49]
MTPIRLLPAAALGACLLLTAALPAHAGTKPSTVGAAGSTGTARVFEVNPVQSTGDESLTDSGDSAAAVPSSAYATVQLRNLDGSGTLTGRWVKVESATGAPATSATNTFLYDRSQDQFEQVMAYFWVNQAQEYLQSLGFGSTLPPVNAQQQDVKVDQYGGDNSYQTDQPFRIRYGKGGVDDAEDAEVIVHEYGHAVHAAQVPGFGASEEAGAIGEAFGDYLGVTVGLAAAKQYGWAVRTPAACVADWDSTSYTSTTPHCLRRLDGSKTVADKDGEVHDDGEIWSRALWDIRNGYLAQGLTTAAADTTIVDAQFRFAPATSFSAAAKATYDTALARDGKKAASTVKAAFAARGILF